MNESATAAVTLDNGVRLHALQTGAVAIHRSQARGKGRGARRRIAVFTDREWTTFLPIIAWAIEHPEGLFFVDTGETAMTSEPSYLPRLHPYYRFAVKFDVSPEQEIGVLAREAGLDPEEATQLILTHLHTDHAGGLHHFEGVPTLVDGVELRAGTGFAGRMRGYLPHRWPEGFSPAEITYEAEPIAGFERSLTVTSDSSVVVIPTPGHSPGHLSILVRDGTRRQVLLAGDAAYEQAALLEGVIDGVGPDETQALDTNRRLRDLVAAAPTVVLPTHDPGSIARMMALEAAQMG